MTGPSYYEDGTKLLTSGAFAFVLDGELKRAVRSRNSLTLVTLEATKECEGVEVKADESTVHEVAEIIGKVVRDTDLIGRTEPGSLALVLLDADFGHSAHVIERLRRRLDSSGLTTGLRIALGAASYPAHAVDAESLKREAQSHPVERWRALQS